MKTWMKAALAVLAVLVLLAVLLPLLINANTFKPRLEEAASKALGRRVAIGSLSFSPFSGALAASGVTVADDPRFSRDPFLSAGSLKVGVEMWPLIRSRQLNVTRISLDKAVVHLISNPQNQWNYASLGSTQNTAPGQPRAQGEQNVSIARLEIENAQVTVSNQGARPSVYDKVTLVASKVSPVSAFPFELSAALPGGGELSIAGRAGPASRTDATLTPVDANIKVTSFDLGRSGLFAAGSGLKGVADGSGHLAANNGDARLTGTATLNRLQVAANGAPSAVPVSADFDLNYLLPRSQGTLNSGRLRLGHASAALKGTFASRGATTLLDMTSTAQGMPIDDLERALPAFGVILPAGSELHGGTLNESLHASGPATALVTEGDIGVFNTRLAGFDLGSKLAAVARFTGGTAPSGATVIERMTARIRYSRAGFEASGINLVVGGIGTITGAGTVSASNALNFNTVARLNGQMVSNLGGGMLASQLPGGGQAVSSLEVPVAVRGTASNPQIIPDVAAVASGMARNLARQRLTDALGGKTQGNSPAGQNLQKTLGGLFGRH